MGVPWATLGASVVDSGEGGLAMPVGILLVGGAVLVALLVAVAARAGRPASTRRPTSASTDLPDPWVEAGRRQGTPSADEGGDGSP